MGVHDMDACEGDRYGDECGDDNHDGEKSQSGRLPLQDLSHIDRSTVAGKLMFNLYGRDATAKQKLINIGKKCAPRLRSEPRPVQPAPRPRVPPGKTKVAVPKFGRRARHEFHPIDFVHHRKAKLAIAEQTNDYEEERAPSMGFVQSMDDRKKCLQKIFEYGADCPPAFLGTVKIKESDESRKKVSRRPKPRHDQLAEVVAGMEERQDFLEEMRAAGMGEKYESQLQGEIAECLRDIKQLESEASAWDDDDL